MAPNVPDDRIVQERTIKETLRRFRLEMARQLQVGFTTEGGITGPARTFWGQNFTGANNVEGNMTGVGSIDATGPVTITNLVGPQLSIRYNDTRRLRVTVASTGWATYTLDNNTYRNVFEQALHVGREDQNNNGIAIINNTGGGFLHFYDAGLAPNNKRWIWTPGEIRASNDAGTSGSGTAAWSATRFGTSITAINHRSDTHVFATSSGTAILTLSNATASFVADVSPSTSNGRDLGTNTLRWRRGYFGTAVHTPRLVNGGAAPPATLTASAGVTLSGTPTAYTITVDPVVAQWGVQAYSTTSFTGAALATATVPATGKLVMFGLGTNPTLNPSYTSINYAIHLAADGSYHVFQLGTLISSHGTYTAGDTFMVRYSGTTVEYLRNGVVFRTTVAAAGQTLFLDSSFDDLAQLTNVTFTAGTSSGGDGIITCDSDLLPDITDARSIGSTISRWLDGWFAGTLTTDTLAVGNGVFTGTVDIAGAVTLAGGLISYGAADSGGVGFRQVLVPN